jgi:DNA-binding LacI/PurR family transcriptional regulator
MDNKNRRNTIKDVAREAGVSTATVSRYINRSGYVDEVTARRIEQSIVTTDYTPSTAARSLKTQKSHILLLVVPDLCNPFYSQMARKVQKLAKEKGYAMVLFDSNGNSDEEISAVRTAVEMYADGILFATIDVRRNVINAILASGIPTVGLNAYEHCEFDTVHVHGYDGTYQAMKHLLELGHTNIAFAGGMPGTVIARSRREGYEHAMHEEGLQVTEERIFEMGFSHEDGYKAGRYLSTLTPLPTAICCANDLIALGVISALSDRGISIPANVSVTGMDNIQYARTSNPRLTTVTNDSEAFADAGVTMLFDRIEDRYLGQPRTVEIFHELIVRNSTGIPCIVTPISQSLSV